MKPGRRRTHFATLGPPIPIVPVDDFSRMPIDVIENAWQIVGPSVERNLNAARNPAALWQIFAACYAEGVSHGAGIVREKIEAESAWTPPSEP